jgi:glutathione synthase/RimK-type ligase-like ATP-grasp enzyme
MPIIALVTARAARGLDEDHVPLEAALKRAGAEPHLVDWDDANVDWSQFDVAVLRSTWDYADRLEEFVAWAERAAQATALLNPLDVVRWNTDKHYLAALADAGVPIIPSEFVEPGADPTKAIAHFLANHDPDEFVVKPAVGAGSRDVFRYGPAETHVAASHAQKLLSENRSVVFQPYLDSVDAAGETALLYFEGQFSHAIRKGPLLRRNQDALKTLFAPEKISPRTPGDDELQVGNQALSAIPFAVPLYARVDLIRDADGAPRVLELELTEPSVFLDHAPGSADHFARIILSRALPFSVPRTS